MCNVNRFMETMQKRNRTGNTEKADGGDNDDEDDEGEDKPAVLLDKRKQRPKTSALTDMPPLSDKQKEKILMKNLLLNKPRLVESAPARKRGNKP